MDSSGNLWVADTNNQRVLEFSSPFSNGMNATLVIGQSSGSFSTRAASTSQSGTQLPMGVSFDSKGDLWVVDTGNNRVLEFVPPFTGGMAATLVIGHSDFTDWSGGTTQTTLSNPTGATFDSFGNLWVADEMNNRVLEFAPPFSDGMSATLVLGQSSFTTNAQATSQNGMNLPTDVAFDSQGNLWVADAHNNRVLEFVPGTSGCASGQFCTGMGAELVIGQPGFSTNSPGTTQSTFTDPVTVAFDSRGGLWIGVFSDHRVVEFAPPFSNGMAASIVIGQSSFTTSTATTTQNGLSSVWGVAFDPAGNMWVVDEGNSRVLEYVGPSPTTIAVSCTPSSMVVGSSSLCTATVSGGSGPAGTISWSAVPLAGLTFSGTTCVLVSGTCGVTVTGSAASQFTVTAIYAGDANNAGSSSTFILNVTSNIVATGVTFSATADAYFTGTIATFTDPDGNTLPAAYSGSIDWGDGTVTTLGVVTFSSGAFSVSGTHAYPSPGTYALTVTISDTDGASATATSTANVFAATQASLADSMTFSDSSLNSALRTIQTTLTDAVSLGDNLVQSTFQTISTSLADTVGVADSAANSIIQTIRVVLTDALGALDGTRSTVTIPQLVFKLSGVSPVNSLVSDPLGREIGCSQAGNIVNQIPGGTVSGCGARFETVSIPRAVVGDYAVYVYGTAASSTKGSHFTLIIKSSNLNGNLLYTLTVTGKTTPSSAEQILVSLFADGQILLNAVNIGMVAVTSLAGSAIAIAVMGRVRSRTSKSKNGRSQVLRKLT